MPLLRIQTNSQLPHEQQRALLATASRLVAHQLGKPEQYVMVTIEHNPAMLFAGEEEPLAYLELKSIGLPPAATAPLSRALCDLVQEGLGIGSDRVYIEFSDAAPQMWGWNGGTF
ncbi:MAG TPA: phenylpyruvate tautomerase MIF-related protein [Gammaproteobacteria bacterium]